MIYVVREDGLSAQDQAARQAMGILSVYIKPGVKIGDKMDWIAHSDSQGDRNQPSM